MQNIDFNNPTKETIFGLCMGKLNILYGNYKDFEIQFNREVHRDLLVKYDLQSYSDMLIEYQKKWFARKDSMFKLKKKVIDTYYEELNRKLKVSKILKMFLSNELNKKSNLVVSFTDLYDKMDIDINLIGQIQEVIIKEFERLKLNETECTREEALEEIHSGDDLEWISQYTSGNCFDGLYLNTECLTEELIDDYKSIHYKLREITLEFVNNVVTDIESSLNEKKGKVGAKIKNLNIGELARRLSYFHRIHLFLNQDKYYSIKDLPLSNETCRFIYEYFEFWGVLNDKIKFDKSEKENRVSYIKALIRNNANCSNKGILDFVKGYTIIDVNLDLKINLFKKVKDGLMSSEEFYIRMSSLNK